MAFWAGGPYTWTNHSGCLIHRVLCDVWASRDQRDPRPPATTIPDGPIYSEATVRHSRPKFAWFVPTLALALTFVALAMPTSVLYLKLRSAAASGAPSVWMHSKDINLEIDRSDMLRFALNGTAAWEQKVITGVHVPGMFGEVLVSLPTTWPQSWHPQSIPLFSWRSFSLPVFCLPFWWLIGLGMDRLSAKRRSHWTLLLLGSMLSAFILFIAIGLNVMGVIEKDTSLAPQISGLYLWTVLFAIFPALWLKQRKWQGWGSIHPD